LLSNSTTLFAAMMISPDFSGSIPQNLQFEFGA